MFVFYSIYLKKDTDQEDKHLLNNSLPRISTIFLKAIFYFLHQSNQANMNIATQHS